MGLCKQVTIVIFVVCLLVRVGGLTPPPPKERQCLTGFMTDIQSWVDENGRLTPILGPWYSIDLSSTINPLLELQTTLKSQDGKIKHYLKYLSLAKCHLHRVPANLATLVDKNGMNVGKTVEYLSLYGNKFISVSTPGEQYDVILDAVNATETNNELVTRSLDQTMWSNGFQSMQFEKLRELDLRACGIESLEANTFKNMPKLEALYLGENMLTNLEEYAFAGLKNLLHLDLSRNDARDSHNNPTTMYIKKLDLFEYTPNLHSLDLSHTKMNQRDLAAFGRFGKSLERLSMCGTGFLKFRESIFNGTSLKILDVSGIYDVLSLKNVLAGLEDTLQVLHANDVGLQQFDIFENFRRLEILSLVKNEITIIPKKTTETLVNLQVLNLARNRIGSWLSPIFRDMPSLKMLDLAENNLNLITEEMIIDFSNISYLGLSDNSLVCNCHSKELIDTASLNELKHNDVMIKPIYEKDSKFSYHIGFVLANELIDERKNISYICRDNSCSDDENRRAGNYLLLDYKIHSYKCLLLPRNKYVEFVTLKTCHEEAMSEMSSKLERGKRRLLALLVIPGLLLPALLVIFIFRRNLRYFYIMIRNSAMLSLVNKHKIIDDDTVFNYDVFVSYCNGDRAWVLDQLLSHLEKDCNVSLCLHERDFQVGLSILENIVSCMDKSKAIMLVISKEFLLSQWCQFEMHLAQHRLLETRREDLILILLEDIPRRLRPNTLHYLMLTKTFIVWPKNKTEQQLFWKRLKKSVATQKNKQRDNMTLA